MCGRFLLVDEEENEEIRRIVEEINKKYTDEEGPKLKTGEIFPTDYIPILAKKQDKRAVGLARWGFPNFKSNGVIINARCETLEEKPTFRKVFHTQRCIIPATGYFEWKQDGSKKTKYLISTETQAFYMAGLFSKFIDKNNTPYVGVVIITTVPAANLAHIHNRMPVILPHDKADNWLEENDPESLKKLLVPYENTTALLSAV